jgi:hypothetical protein
MTVRHSTQYLRIYISFGQVIIKQLMPPVIAVNGMKKEHFIRICVRMDACFKYLIV